MFEQDRFTVANSARIPCTVRTLKPYYLAGEVKPWVHSGEISDALLYLASRAALPEDEIIALKGLLERLSSSLQALSASEGQAPVNGENTGAPSTPTTPAGKPF